MKSRLSLNSVRVRLALWNVGVLALVLVGLGIVFSVSIQANVNAAVNRRLSQRASHARHFFDDPPPFRRPPPPPDGRRDADAASDEMRPRLFRASGRPLMPKDMPWDTSALNRAEQGEEVYSTVRAGADDLRVFSLPLRQQGRIVGVAQAAESLTRIYADRARMIRTLLYLIPLVLLAAGLGGAFLTDLALRPVRRIAQAAGRIEAQNLSSRLPVLGQDEFADLAETFNHMLSRLQSSFESQEAAFEQQRRFAADASHELRTPLTIIKANASLALSRRRTEDEYEKTLRAVDAAADRMGRIVQDLLLLARADAGQLAYALVPTPLADVLALAASAVAAPERPAITLDLPTPLWVRGSVDSLVRLFTNLLENAARHTPPDGRITVSAHRQGDRTVVAVADTGEGIAPEHLPHVTERFYRAEAARSRAHGGTGLGLSICRSIVDAHGGSLEIESRVGMGTTVRITLPWADPSGLPEEAAEPKARDAHAETAAH